MRVELRRATKQDQSAVELVESQATRNLKYLPFVYDEFVSDMDGEFSVAEVDGEIAGCGKFTVLPDGSAWLEALRVMPSHQGKGIGKAFYQRFFDLAHARDIRVMRMYTGVKNVVSKGLAERFGFTLAAKYRGAGKSAGDDEKAPAAAFVQVNDPKRATGLLMPLKERWTGFVVMNRTFCELTPSLCEAWTREGKVFEDPASGSVVALGARFMPKQAVHFAVFGGDEELCLDFAMSHAAAKGVSWLQCMFPPGASDIQKTLVGHGFNLDESDYIVMQVKVDTL